MRKRKIKSLYRRGVFSKNNAIKPTCRIEINRDFIQLLSAATQTKPEKTISNLYFHFLGEYKKFQPNSILFKRKLEKEHVVTGNTNYSFTYKIYGFKIKINAAIFTNSNETPYRDMTTFNLFIIFTQGDGIINSGNYRKVFDIKYLEDKMFSEQLFG